jgi:hypothetical protein
MNFHIGHYMILASKINAQENLTPRRLGEIHSQTEDLRKGKNVLPLQVIE